MSEHFSGKLSYLIGIFLFCIFSYSSVKADSNLLNYKSDSFSTKVSKSDGNGETITLKIFNSKHKKSSVFSVPDPDRIVVDLIGATLKKNKDFQIKSSLVKSLRLGAHSDKARIVIDLSADNSSTYRTLESQGELTIIIERAAQGIVSKKRENDLKPAATATVVSEKIIKKIPTSEPTVEIDEEPVKPSPIPTIKLKATVPTKDIIEEEIIIENDNSDVMIEELIKKKPLPTPIKLPTKAPTIAPTIVNTPAHKVTIIPTELPTIEPIQTEIKAEATPLPQTQSLRGIKFAYTQGLKSNPVIKIDLVNKSQFELQKSDDKTYTLTIKDCRELPPELKLVNFPPHDFVGFTYLQAASGASDIEIKIGVERNKRITATPNENEIWISLLNETKTESKPINDKKESAVQKSMNRPGR